MKDPNVPEIEAFPPTRRLAAIVDSSDDAIVSKDLDGIVTSWNPAAERMFGYPAAEAIGKSITLIIPTDRLSEEREVISRIRRGDRVTHYETIRRRKDGSMIPISLSVSPIRAENGSIIGASKIARDITERKEAEAALARAAEEQRALHAQQRRARERAAFLAQVGATLARTLDSRRTLVDIATLAVPQIADWCAVDLLSASDPPERVAIAHADPAKKEAAENLQRKYPPDPSSPYGVYEVLRTGRSVLMSNIPPEMLEAAAQDSRHMEAILELGLTSYMCVPMVAHGRTLGAVTFVAAQAGHHYDADDLTFAEDVVARTALAVDNARAYEETQQANRLKDEFLATLSHELRTPLNAILGYARMMRTGALPPERQENALAVVERNAASLSQMVEDVLDVSRIISGKIRLNVQTMPIDTVIDHAVATVAPAAEAKGIQLATVSDRTIGAVSGDPDRLQQVVWNLLSNSVKFTPRGGRVEVRLARIDGHVEIVVSDSGRGIPAEFLPHMFERFRQADGGFSREHGGLGLGLAISRHIVEAHGGTIEASSGGLGNGATFHVRLPTTTIPSERPVTHPRADERTGERWMSQVTPGVLAGMRVLAVDDDGDARELLRTILESAGGEVTIASSAREALDLLHANTYDVLLADIGMPQMSGLDLIRAIRTSADGRVRGVAAAALTAYARSEDRINALQAGYQMHLAKPVNPGELVTGLALLARRPAES